MTQREQLIDILNRIQSGEITPKEGLEKMRAHDTSNEGLVTGAASENIVPTEKTADIPIEGTSQDITGSSMSSDALQPDDSQVDKVAEEKISFENPDLAETSQASSSFTSVPELDGQLVNQSTGPSDRKNGAEPAEKMAGQSVGEVGAEREIRYWKLWWSIPFWIGTVVMVLGTMGMYYGYLAAQYGLGFWLATIPFILGVIVMALSWQSRMARWLHVRVHQKPGEKPGTISISFPLPIGLASWFLRNFSHLVPGLRDQQFSGSDLSDMLSTLGESVSPENPFYVHVNGNAGEEVEVFIG